MARITISITAPGDAPEQDLLTLDLPDGMTTAGLKALIQGETGFATTSQHLYHNGQLLADDARPLAELGIGDGEMLAMHVRDMVGETGVPATGPAAAGVRPAHAAAAAAAPTGLPSRPAGGGGAAGPDPEMIRLQILADPRGRAEVRAQNPDLVDAAEDPDRFRRVFLDLQRQQADADRARQREMAMLNDDYLNPEAQAKIEEVIRQKAVMENLQNALEYNPEAFGKVHMLYVDVEVNNHKVKAFVDSGAQATIMSPSCAEACGIMRLVDRRFAGIARGVGTAKIIGRVHWAQIKIGNIFLACSFTVMEGKDVELLLGLDMLKRHQARIDLGADRLAIQGENVPFLGEADIPKTDAADALNEPSVEGPGGTRVGARSGAVVQTPAGPSGPQGPGGAPTSFAGQGLTLGGRAPAPPPQAQPPVQQQPQPQHQAQAATYPAETIAQLQQLGFSRAEAIAALDATGGNVDYAAGLLFQER